MIPKNAYMPPRSAWFGLLALLVVALLALAACGGSSNASAGSPPSPTTVANTPTAGTASATPATTPVTTPATTPAPGTTQVVMVITESSGAYGFSPATLTIRAGTTVIWKNVSSAPHTVTSDDGQAFDSGTVAVGGSYRFTFKTAGAFPYHCNYHPYMRATINVV